MALTPSRYTQKPYKGFLSLLESELLGSWWMFLLLLGAYGVYEQGMQGIHTEKSVLSQQLYAAQKEKNDLELDTADLLLQINSQSDPAWIEQVLMLRLGLTPEGQTKVFFKESTQ